MFKYHYKSKSFFNFESCKPASSMLSLQCLYLLLLWQQMHDPDKGYLAVFVFPVHH